MSNLIAVIMSAAFLLAMIAIAVLVWYIQRLVNNLKDGVKNVDELQSLLSEYSDSLESVLELEQFYGEQAIVAAVGNTKMVIEACKFYKNSILNSEDNTIETNKEEGK